MMIFSLGVLACQEAAVAPDDEAATVSGTPLSYDLLAAYAWKQLTRSPGKFSLCRFTRDESRLDQLRVTMSTGNGLSIQGVFRFTDDEMSAAQRSGLFIMDGGLIEESVTLRLLPKDQSLIIIDSMGQEQKLRRMDSLSRSR
jgi:hypothetical protein